MKRRDFIKGTTCAALALATEATVVAANEETIYVSAFSGADTNPGTKAAPLRTIMAAAKRVNDSTATGAMTIILDEGVYAITETAMFQPTKRQFSKAERLTLRAAVLPDDPDWIQGKMPVITHEIPLSKDWNGRPDQFDGVAYGMQFELSHVTVQGLRILGMPIIENTKPGAIHRLYAIGRIDGTTDDLEIKQCVFEGDEVVSPNHLALLVNGSALVVDHCIFYGVKQTAVYWTPGSKGHAMRNCLIYGSYACGIWTSGVASDLDYRNNVVSNSNYVWIGQGAQSARAEMAQLGRGPGGPPAGGPPGGPGGPPPGFGPGGPGGASGGFGGRGGSGGRGGRGPAGPVAPENRYHVYNSLFAGNKHFTGSGAGPALNFRDNDPAFLVLHDTKTTDQVIQLELDQTKRNYLHAVAGSEAAKIGAGLFIKPV